MIPRNPQPPTSSVPGLGSPRRSSVRNVYNRDSNDNDSASPGKTRTATGHATFQPKPSRNHPFRRVVNCELTQLPTNSRAKTLRHFRLSPGSPLHLELLNPRLLPLPVGAESRRLRELRSNGCHIDNSGDRCSVASFNATSIYPRHPISDGSLVSTSREPPRAIASSTALRGQRCHLLGHVIPRPSAQTSTELRGEYGPAVPA